MKMTIAHEVNVDKYPIRCSVARCGPHIEPSKDGHQMSNDCTRGRNRMKLACHEGWSSIRKKSAGATVTEILKSEQEAAAHMVVAKSAVRRSLYDTLAFIAIFVVFCAIFTF